jgi:nucleotide-binding universal stress UspA family protein
MSAAILAGYDPRARDRAPVELGATLAELSGARLIVASVQAREPITGTFPGTALPFAVEPVDDDLIPDCSDAIAELKPELRARHVQFDCRVIDGISAARSLQSAAEADDIALLVVGAGKRGPVLGSTAHRLLHGAPCPVAVAPHAYTGRPLGTVAAAVSGADRAVIEAAHALAKRARALLRIITVVHVTPGMYALTEHGTDIRPPRTIEDVAGEFKAMTERELRTAVAGVDDVELDVSAFVGDPADVLIELSEHLDALVCGSRGYGPLRAVLLGSVSHRLVAESHCPVIVLPRGVREPLGALFASATATA